MRYLYLALVIILVVLVAIFTFQNLEMVTVEFFRASITLPRAVMIVGVYLLGMVTGGFVFSLFRGWWRGAKRRN